MLRPTIVAVVVAVAALVATSAGAQPAAERRPPGKQDDAADAYGEMLRRTDSARTRATCACAPRATRVSPS